MALSVTVTGLAELEGILGNLGKAAASLGASSAVIGSASPVAGYVTYGTSPHTIAAVTARALHWESGGGSFFATSVHHPGTKPNPFAEEALLASEGAIRTLVDDAFTVIATGGPVSAAVAAIDAAGELVLKAVQEHAPVRTGGLRDSFTLVAAGRLP